MTPQKVVHLTTVHSPRDNRVFYKECVTLAAAGYDVTLIAVADTGGIVSGVRVRPLIASAGRLRRMAVTTVQAFAAALAEHAAVYHFHDPELLPVGLALKALGMRVIYDAHEEVAQDLLTKRYVPARLRRPVAAAAHALELGAAWALDAVVAATPAIARQFLPRKTVLIQNFPRSEDLISLESARPYAERPMSAAFIGAITPERGIAPMIAALRLLADRHPSARLTLAGLFAPAALETAMRGQPGWAHVDFHGWQERAAVRALLAVARVGLVLFQPGPNHLEAMPNKLFEYMAAGLPVVASNFPLWRSIVEGSRCGLVVDPSNPRAISDALDWVFAHPIDAQHMGELGRRAVVASYSWDREAEKLLALYARLLGSAELG